MSVSNTKDQVSSLLATAPLALLCSSRLNSAILPIAHDQDPLTGIILFGDGSHIMKPGACLRLQLRSLAELVQDDDPLSMW